MSARKVGLAFLTAASPLLLLTFVGSSVIARALFTVLVMLFPVALIAVGVGRLGSLRWPLALLGVILEASALGILALSRSSAWLAGFPVATTLLIYGLWLTPLGLVTLAYAVTFSRPGSRRQT